jgi:tetratricopeptide (TPR) repeat protein
MSRGTSLLLLWRIGLGTLGVLLLWRIVILGVSDHYAAQIDVDGESAAQKALAWNPSNSQALRILADWTLAQDPASAAMKAERSLQADPTDARALLVLAHARLVLGETEPADRHAEQAARLMPVKASVQLGLAEYWIKRQRTERALAHLDRALRVKPGLSEELFPRLLEVAESFEARELLAPAAHEPAPWWGDFFLYVCRKALSLETVSALKLMRRGSALPLSEGEREALVERLLKERQWPAAYLAWVNGLDPDRRRYLGSVYNGGFEAEISSIGFDWQLPRIKGFNAARRHTYGIRGEKALHLVFTGRELQFRHLRQRLFLAPGGYSFRSMVRPQGLQGRGGLSWTVYCADSPEADLGRSGRFLGSSDWRWSQFDFVVPSTGCAGQELRLESLGRTSFDHKLEGEIWLDQVSIRRVDEEQNLN